MNVAVLGGTGRTGRPLISELLRRGHTVTALVRSPEKLASPPAGLQVVTGTSTDPGALSETLTGADAVVSALGPTSKETTLHSDTARALVGAMPTSGVSRFVGISGAGVDVPGDQKGPRDRAISFLINRVGGAVVKDKVSEYQLFAACDLDWTLVRPPRLVDGTATGAVYHDAHTPGRSSSLRREDLAVFLADVLDGHLFSRQAPFVSQGR